MPRYCQRCSAGASTVSGPGIDWDPTSGLPQPTILGGNRYIRGPDGALSSRTGLVDTNLGRDMYGSIISPTGNARATAYDSFGVPTGTNTWTPTLGYRGEIVIDSLSYLRARNYDTSKGVFTSRDPLGGVVGTPVTANPYHYGNNNPLMNLDPTGMSNVNDNLYGFATDAWGVSRQTYGDQVLVNGQWVNQRVLQYALQQQARAEGAAAEEQAGMSDAAIMYAGVNKYNPINYALVHGDRCITGETALSGPGDRAGSCVVAGLAVAGTIVGATMAASTVALAGVSGAVGGAPVLSYLSRSPSPDGELNITQEAIQAEVQVTNSVTVNLSTANRSVEEAKAINQYASRTNSWLEENGPQTIRPTDGALRAEASAAARAERLAAQRAGTPYGGQAAPCRIPRSRGKRFRRAVGSTCQVFQTKFVAVYWAPGSGRSSLGSPLTERRRVRRGWTDRTADAGGRERCDRR